MFKIPTRNYIPRKKMYKYSRLKFTRDRFGMPNNFGKNFLSLDEIEIELLGHSATRHIWGKMTMTII